MLIKLSVQNYALIKELDVELENGLTIITGETGAGKSILMGALSLILGNRADTSVLLDKNDKCIVEGTFRIDEYELNDFFLTNELDYEPVTMLRREINPAGKSRAFINDTPVTLNLLREIGEKLIDIHSQHQTLMLNDNSFQLNVIDSFAGTAKLLRSYRFSYFNYRKLKKEHTLLKESYDKNKADIDYFQFQISQLEDARLKEGEQEELEAEQELLGHAEEIKSALAGSSLLFTSDETSILSLLRAVKLNIGRIKNFLPEGELLYSRTESSIIELDDLAGEIEKLAISIEADPQRLARVNERLDLFYSLFQKHRVKDLNELIVKISEMKEHLNTLVSSDERLNELESLLQSEEGTLRNISHEISGKRKSIITEVELKITELLRQLGMPNARFRIELSSASDFKPSGIDNADFLFSANKQIAPENLSKIASGGELSRVMLSLKSLLSRNNNLPTIIFDEIDSGVSGEVADKVGQILAGMGKYMQVVNITHLPQVASRGTKHYHVYKDDTDDSTITRVRLLSADERVLEVARLLSGSEVTETAMKNARELIKAAIN
ncbi:MAG: DNA repair protein RecN [Bacteroidetes bacterium GWE2_41_25]|nr:MAG: DNA repair protein RecN [Bacteroidetes bacterium GWA2_40_15]OFX90372.1 MAG: DNA repair protein RecN [Bacteroidetes bacterium GWC2_40_22]OFY08964.1 MAG: DNA repair protein RecN [Bacteroidetes bacterium GWE2_41_25]OFY57800.1 MAG: DNA repair protein RecN [Bacteroidetes bacterium GWF2_41_9]HAM10678.1 DNA repair protein RecN [Bacteroidales bacterium]